MLRGTRNPRTTVKKRGIAPFFIIESKEQRAESNGLLHYFRNDTAGAVKQSRAVREGCGKDEVRRRHMHKKQRHCEQAQRRVAIQ